MSSYLYFPNNLKDIKNNIDTYIISCKIFFQENITVSSKNMNLYLFLSFCSGIMFVTETVFISEQITDEKFEELLEIK